MYPNDTVMMFYSLYTKLSFMFILYICHLQFYDDYGRLIIDRSKLTDALEKCVKGFVSFAKVIPGFNALDDKMQLHLTKGKI